MPGTCRLDGRHQCVPAFFVPVRATAGGRACYDPGACHDGTAGSAYRIHMQWFYSTGHHNNYMLSSYVKGACAIYVYQGVWYAVENFALEESENSGGTLSCNAYGPEAEAALNEYIDSHDW